LDIQAGVAIVTGSSSGVGAAVARQLAEQGCHVVINYAHNQDGAQKTQHACEVLGVETLVVQADVSADADCRRMVQLAEDKWGRVDVLVNNAGTTKFCAHDDLEGLTQEDFLELYRVNTVGAFQMVRAVSPMMKLGGRGAIVNVASIAGVTGIGSSIAYAASKGALLTLTKSLARALGPEIRVNAICPGFIQGDWLEKGLGTETYHNIKASIEARAPLKMTATADSVAQAILSMIVGADIVTGESLIIDGGMFLN